MKKKRTLYPYTLVLLVILEIASMPLARAQAAKAADADSVSAKRKSSDTGLSRYSKNDSPVLRKQLKEGLHNLGADIQDAWGTLKGDVKNAGKAGKKYVKDQRSKDSVASAVEANREKRKEVVKVYAATANDILSVNNKYGKVSASTWDKDEIRVEISIRVKGGPDSLLQESLDRVTIKENREENMISLETEVASRKENALQALLKNRPDINYQVNYKIFLRRPKNVTTNETKSSDI